MSITIYHKTLKKINTANFFRGIRYHTSFDKAVFQ